MAHSRFALLVIGVVVLISQAAPVAAFLPPEVASPPGAAVPVCNSKYKGGLTPSGAELKEILRQHAAWLKDYIHLSLDSPKAANDTRRANLCGANLNDVDMNGVVLTDADLSGARLSSLKDAILGAVDWPEHCPSCGGTDADILKLSEIKE